MTIQQYIYEIRQACDALNNSEISKLTSYVHQQSIIASKQETKGKWRPYSSRSQTKDQR